MPEPLDDRLSRFPGYALRRAATAMMGDLSARLAEIDCRISDASILLLIEDRKDVTASQIGTLLDIKRANMVPVIGRLEMKGLIRKVPLDGRSLAIVLTPKGRRRRARAQTITEDFEKDLLKRVPLEHRKHLKPALNALW